MSTKILIDSACDLTKEEAQKLNVKVLPLHILFGQDEYIDGVTLNHEAFYEKLIETDVFPTTSQISPFNYSEEFKKETADGSSVICITISSRLSGCYQSALIAAEDYPDKVFVVDSENVCVGQLLLCEIAASLRDLGKSPREIVNILERKKHDIRVVALVDTLEYLKKGGRISTAVAIAGNLLSIKPVIAIIHGEVALVGKARGSKAGNNKLNELITQDGGINFAYPVRLAYSGLSDMLLKKYMEDCSYLYEGKLDTLPISSIGCTVGTHVGPNAIAIAYIAGNTN